MPWEFVNDRLEEDVGIGEEDDCSSEGKKGQKWVDVTNILWNKRMVSKKTVSCNLRKEANTATLEINAQINE